MKNLVRIVAYFCLCLNLVLSARGAPETGPTSGTTAQHDLKEADLTLVQADIARDNAKRNEAINLYREALSRYTDLSRKYPGWQPAVVEFRAGYCSDQLEALVGAIERQFTPAPTPAPSTEAIMPREPEPIAIAPPVKEPVKDDVKVEPKPAAETRVEPKLPEPRIEPPETPVPSDKRTADEIKRETLRLMRLGQWQEAQSMLSQRVDVLRQDDDARLLLALAHCQNKTHDESVRILTDILDKNATNAPAHVALGAAYIGVGSFGLARSEMERALGIDPNLSEAHYNLAQILTAINPPDIEAARSHYAKALELGGAADATFEELLKK